MSISMSFSKSLLFPLLLLPGLAFAGTGAELYNEFMDSDAMYPDEEWQEYVDMLGQKLVKRSADKGREYYFFMLDSPDVNAFATADAYIYINRGLVAYMASEEQLAAVIGHEIAHVVARHPAKRRTTNLLGTGAGLAAMLLTGRMETYEAADMATQALIAGYGRDMELEADRIGAEIIARAGYNPLAVIDAVHILKDRELYSREVTNQPRNYHGLFATHPQNDKRLHDAVSYALTMLPETTDVDESKFWELMDGLSYGSDAPSGVNADNVYYDKSQRLAIEFPKDWNVTHNRQQIVARAPSGRDEGLISITKMSPNGDEDPADFVTSKLRILDAVSESEIELEGCCDVYWVEQSVEQTNKKISILAIRDRGSDRYVIRGEAGTRGDAEDLVEKTKNVIKGIRNLKVSDLQTSHTQRIRVVVAKPGDTYEKLAQQSSLRRYAEDTLRVLNGHHPNGEPRAGDYIKIVQ